MDNSNSVRLILENSSKIMESSSLSFSGKKKSELTLPTTVNLETESDESIDKIQIYDEMQERMADYLETKQQVGSLQNQIAVFKQRLLQMENDFNKEKQDLHDRLMDLENKNEHLTNANSELNKNIEELQNENNKMHEEIIRLENKNHTDQLAQKESMDRMLKEREEHYRSIITNLEQDVAKFKDQASSSQVEFVQCRDSLLKKSADYEKLQHEYFEMNTKCELAIADQKESEDRCKSLRSIIKQQQDENSSMHQLFQTQSDKLASVEKALDDKTALMRTVVKERDSLQLRLSKIREILPEYSDFTEFYNKLKERVEIAEALPIELRKYKKKLANAIKALQISDAKYNEKDSKLDEALKPADELKQELNNTNAENSDIRHKFGLLNIIKTNVSVIEASNREISHRFNEIKASLDNTVPHFSLRSLLISTIVLKRWKNLLGTPRAYEKDTRNWWWICGDMEVKQQKNWINEKINQVKSVEKELNDQISSLKSDVARLTDSCQQKEEEIAAKDSHIYQQDDRITKLNLKIEDLSNQVNMMVDPSVHKEIEDLLWTTKAKLAETLKALSKTTENLVFLQHECSVLRHMKDNSTEKSTQVNDENQKLKNRISMLEGKIKELNVRLEQKDQEIINSEKKAKKVEPYYITGYDLPGRQKAVISCIPPNNNSNNFFY